MTDLLVSYGLVLLFGLVALESAGVPLPGETALVAAAILATPNQLKMPQITFVAGNLTPGVYFDACNPTAAPIDPQPFTVRVNTIGA